MAHFWLSLALVFLCLLLRSAAWFLGTERAFLVLQLKALPAKFYVPGLLAKAGCFPVVYPLKFFKSGTAPLVVDKERLG